MNNHLVGKTDILEPRAKIGDVVIVPMSLIPPQKIEVIGVSGNFYKGKYLDGEGVRTFSNKDILKNLTTNTVYA